MTDYLSHYKIDIALKLQGLIRLILILRYSENNPWNYFR